MAKPFVVTAISVLSALTFTHAAQARDDHGHGLLYSCNMSFHASGKSIYIGIGYTELSGEGTLSCYNFAQGNTEQIPLRVTAHGPGAGLGVTGLVLSGGATGIGVSSGPEALFGRYLMVRGSAAAGVGAGAGAALHLSNGSATVDVLVQAQTGLGAGVDLLWIKLEPLNSHVNSYGLDLKQADLKPALRSDVHTDLHSDLRTDATNLTPTAARNPGDTATTARAALIPSSTVTLHDGQPIELLDANGRVTQLIYVNRQ